MLNNTRYLHILIGNDSSSRMNLLSPHLMKRKYPGEHIALVREEDAELIRSQDFFHEVITLDCTYIQKSAFSPLLGDATAFNVFWEAVHPLTQTSWAKIFNLGGSSVETAIASLFNTQSVIGPVQQNSQVACTESPLKLAKLLNDWNMSHPIVKGMLQRKSLQQLDLAPLEKTFQQIGEIKSIKSSSTLKSALVGVRINDFSEVEASTIEFLGQLFTLVALDKSSAQGLIAFGISFVDWTEKSSEDHLFLDLIIQDATQNNNFWMQTLDLRGKSADELTDRLAEILPVNFAKWSCLSFLFDYLGQPRLALQSEKILTRYDRQALQPFLYQEVLNLKDFAKVMLEGLRKQGTGHHSVLQDYWNTRPGVLSFVSAIELSISPSIAPMFRNDNDVIMVKNRLRLLNGFYERIHKACTLDIPKTDLALTL